MDNFEYVGVAQIFVFSFGDFNAKTERKEKFLDNDNFFLTFF